MGCYRLTYEYKTTELFVEQGEKNYSLKWHVTVNAGSKLGEEGDKVSSGDGPPGFWGRIGDGFGKYGQAWGDMFSGAYTYLTPNVYRSGTGNANGQGGPPPRPGRRAVWVDWDVMTLSMLGFDQKPALKAPTNANAKDMTLDKNYVDALDAWSPANTGSSLGPKAATDTIYFLRPQNNSYDSSYMSVDGGLNWIPSGKPNRNH